MSGDIPVSLVTETSNQSVLLALKGGGYVLAWSDYGPKADPYNNNSASNAYAQVYDANGNTVGSVITIGQLASSSAQPAMVATTSGGFIVTWQSGASGTNIYQREFSATGAIMTPISQVNTTNPINYLPSIASYAGGYAVAYMASATTTGTIITQLMLGLENASGVPQGTEVAVHAHAGYSQQNVFVVRNSDGGFLVTWEERNGTTKAGVFVQRYDASGNTVGSPISVGPSNAAMGNNVAPIAVLAGGGFIVLINNSNVPQYQRYDSSGNAVGIPTGIQGVNKYMGSIFATADGGFLITGVFGLGTDASPYTAVAMGFNAAGVQVTGMMPISATMPTNQADEQFQTAGIVTASGHIVYTWTKGSISQLSWGQVYLRDTVAGATLTLHQPQDIVSVIISDLQDGTVVAHSATQITVLNDDGDTYHIFNGEFANFDSDGVPHEGTITSYTATDTSHNVIATLTGIGLDVPAFLNFIGDNDVAGMEAALFSGNDTFYGSAGSDVLYGGAGNDLIIGGGGSDTVVVSSFNQFFYNSDGSVTIFGPDGTDTLVGIGFVTQTQSNTTVQMGGGLADTIVSSGHDINAGSGDDTITIAPNQTITVNGGGGTDTVFINGASTSFTLTPHYGSVGVTGNGENLTLQQVEYVHFTDKTVRILFGANGTAGAAGSNGASPTAGGAGGDVTTTANSADVVPGSGLVNEEAVAGTGGTGGSGSGSSATGGAGGKGGNASIIADGIVLDPNQQFSGLSLYAFGGDGGHGGTSSSASGADGAGGNAAVEASHDTLTSAVASFARIHGIAYGGQSLLGIQGGGSVVLDHDSLNLSGLNATASMEAMVVGASSTASQVAVITNSSIGGGTATSNLSAAMTLEGQTINLQTNNLTATTVSLSLYSVFSPAALTFSGNNFTGQGSNATFSIADLSNTWFDGSGPSAGTYVLDMSAGTLKVNGQSNTLSGFQNAAILASTGSSITGNANNNSLTGGLGNDTINGGDGNDTINGGLGNNVLNGGNGADIINSAGNDTIDGGTGNDTINLGQSGVVSANGGAGGDTFNMGASLTATDSIVGGGDDYLNGVVDQVVLQGNYPSLVLGANTLVGIHTMTLVGATSGGDSTNVYNLTLNANTATAGQQLRIIGSTLSSTNAVHVDASATAGSVTVRGGSGNDSFIGGSGNDVFRPGLGGASTFNGGGGTNRVSFFNAGTSNGVSVDLNIGTAQTTGLGTITLTNVQDISGTMFADVIKGNGQNNSLESAGGSDDISGGGGNDVVEIANGGQTSTTTSQADGGTGTDLLSFYLNGLAGAGATFDLSSSAAQVTGQGTVIAANFENLQGTSFIDQLTGDTGNNILYGAEGNDVLSGGDGDDTLYGDKVVQWQTLNTYESAPVVSGTAPGNDTLNGGNGNDTLVGGGGNDTIVGEAGIDTAVFAGNASAWTVTRNGDGSVSVAGAGGTSSLTGVEKLQFDDKTIALTIARNDFNADGKSDILWQNSDGTAAVWLLNGTTLNGGNAIGNPGSASWKAIGTGDFDGDGKADILWQNTDGTPAVWLMNGSTIAGGGVPANPGAGWTVLGASDFNGDGKSDILWRAADGSIAIWLMNGATLTGGAVAGNPGNSWSYKGYGDFDGDGKTDLVFQNTDGSIAVWLMNGAAIASGAVAGNPGGTWTIKAVGDFDGDGKSDLLLQDASGQAAIWQMNGISVAGGGLAGSNPGTTWTVKQAEDVNGDGKADILWQAGDGSPAVWLMNGTTVTGGGIIGGNPGSNWHIVTG